MTTTFIQSIDHKGETIMKWEYNEPHTTNLHSPALYLIEHTNYQDR